MREGAEFFITQEAARQALKKLASCRIHEQFAGYLAAVAAKAANPQTNDTKIDFKAFFDYFLKVSNSPTRPYLVPFSGGTGKASLFNKNVAGSYAPSSVRDVAPIRKLLTFHGRGQRVTHVLDPDHERIANTYLASSERVPIHSLATFLFRDYSIAGDAETEIDSVVNRFCRDFGYDLSVEADRKRFSKLYRDDRETFSGITYAEYLGDAK